MISIGSVQTVSLNGQNSVIELVDSISRDAPDTPLYIKQQKAQKLSPDSISSFLTFIHSIFARFTSHSKNDLQNYSKAQPGHVKTGQVDIILSVLLGLIRHSLNLSPWF